MAVIIQTPPLISSAYTPAVVRLLSTNSVRVLTFKAKGANLDDVMLYREPSMSGEVEFDIHGIFKQGFKTERTENSVLTGVVQPSYYKADSSLQPTTKSMTLVCQFKTPATMGVGGVTEYQCVTRIARVGKINLIVECVCTAAGQKTIRLTGWPDGGLGVGWLAFPFELETTYTVAIRIDEPTSMLTAWCGGSKSQKQIDLTATVGGSDYISLGCGSGGVYQFKGELYFAKCWFRALTDEEVAITMTGQNLEGAAFRFDLDGVTETGWKDGIKNLTIPNIGNSILVYDKPTYIDYQLLGMYVIVGGDGATRYFTRRIEQFGREIDYVNDKPKLLSTIKPVKYEGYPLDLAVFAPRGGDVTYIFVSPNNLTILRGTATGTITLESSDDWHVLLEPEAFTLSQSSGGAGTYTITITAKTDAWTVETIRFINTFGKLATVQVTRDALRPSGDFSNTQYANDFNNIKHT